LVEEQGPEAVVADAADQPRGAAEPRKRKRGDRR
jgi:hypothetical protein